MQNGSFQGSEVGNPLQWLRTTWPYNHKLRRRLRTVSRLGSAIVDPRSYPTAPAVQAFWFDDIANFGDQLTPWLLRRSGAVPIRTTPQDADLCGVGSILHMLPAGFQGDIWGSGLLEERTLALPEARWLGVRGALTLDLVGAPGGTPLGDPGLLASKFMSRQRPRARIGIVPHHAHEDDPLWASLARTDPGNVLIINVRRRPSAVIRDIASCAAIFSTSLHGLVIADSYGIPAVWAEGPDPLMGGDFKFRDYLSAVGGSPRKVDVSNLQDLNRTLATTRPLDAARVRAIQDELLVALHSARVRRVSPPRAALEVIRRSASSTPS